jgi:hypothetical protein
MAGANLMAISKQSELVAAIKNYLNRSSLADARISEFIAVGEGYIHYGIGNFEPFRHSSMETEVDLAVSARTVALPARHLETKRLYVDGTPVEFLEFVSPERMWSMWAGSSTGKPKSFSVEGENYLFGPGPDDTYTIKCQYIAAFTALVADDDTNWLLANQPGSYLYASLIEAGAYLRDRELMEFATGQFANIIGALNQSDQRKQFSGSTWVSRPDHGSP